jgi:hypothetical protein
MAKTPKYPAIRCICPPKLHAKFKEVCIKNDSNMKSTLLNLVENYIKDAENRR